MKIRFVGICIAGAAVWLVASCGSDSTSPKKETFVAQLTANQEKQNDVVTSSATGTATVIVQDENTITYRVDVQNLSDIILSHFHAGTPDISGKVLFDFKPGARTGSFSGTLESGTITRTSSFATGFTFDSLLTRLRSNALYVNVHTTKYPGGELRGNLTPAP